MTQYSVISGFINLKNGKEHTCFISSTNINVFIHLHDRLKKIKLLTRSFKQNYNSFLSHSNSLT